MNILMKIVLVAGLFKSSHTFSMMKILDAKHSYVAKEDCIDFLGVENYLGASLGKLPTENIQMDELQPAKKRQVREAVEDVRIDGVRNYNTTAYPYICFCYIRAYYKSKPQYVTLGSGVAVGPLHVLTAAHTLVDDKGEWVESLTVQFALNEHQQPFEQMAGTRVYIPEEYFGEFRQRYDYALIILDQSIETRIGWLGLFYALGPAALANREIHVTGYPSFRVTEQMWTLQKKIKTISPQRLFYDVDSYGGNSGGPIWGYFKLQGNRGGAGECPLVMGIHTHNIELEIARQTFGTKAGVRLTKENFDQLIRWIRVNGALTGWWSINKGPAYEAGVVIQIEGDNPIIGSPLHNAVLNLDANLVHILLQQGTNVHFTDLRGNGPLHVAAHIGSLPIAKVLIEKGGALVNATNLSWQTPLHLAALANQIGVLKFLLEVASKLKVNLLDVHDWKGNSALHLAAQNGHVEAVKLLLKWKANRTILNDEFMSALGCACTRRNPALVESLAKGYRETADELSPLLVAARYGTPEVLSILVRYLGRDCLIKKYKGVSIILVATKYGNVDVINAILDEHPDEVRATDTENNTPLHYVERHQTVDIFCQGGGLVNQMNKSGKSPLHMALERGEPYEVIEALLRQGADANLPDAQGTLPLHLVVKSDYLLAVGKIIEYMDPRAVNKHDSHNFIALHYVKSPAVAELLIGLKSELDRVGNGGKTPLHMIIQELDDSNLTMLLLDAGASDSILNDEGQSLLHVAVKFERIANATFLLSRGVREIDSRDKLGRTALHWAAFTGNLELVKLLKIYGADLNVLDKKKRTPAQLAENEGYLEVAQELEPVRPSFLKRLSGLFPFQ